MYPIVIVHPGSEYHVVYRLVPEYIYLWTIIDHNSQSYVVDYPSLSSLYNKKSDD